MSKRWVLPFARTVHPPADVGEADGHDEDEDEAEDLLVSSVLMYYA